MAWIRISMDPELLPGSGSGTRKIRIRNKSFRIHNTGKMCFSQIHRHKWIIWNTVFPQRNQNNWQNCPGWFRSGPFVKCSCTTVSLIIHFHTFVRLEATSWTCTSLARRSRTRRYSSKAGGNSPPTLMWRQFSTKSELFCKNFSDGQEMAKRPGEVGGDFANNFLEC